MKLHAYLSKSRHGVFYIRWPIPNTDSSEPRKSIRLSLGTRCPREAGSLARRLAICGEAILEDMEMSSMNHAELRATIEYHFRAILAEAKQRRSELGPFTQEQKEGLRTGIALKSMDNLDYWKLLGRKNARAELDSFCTEIGIEVPKTRERAVMILDEIRKVQKALGEAMLEHGLSLEAYDFTEPVVAPETGSATSVSVGPSTPLTAAVDAFLGEHSDMEGWTAGTLQKRTAMLDLLLEWFGPETDMQSIGKTDAAHFKNAVLLKLPTNRSKATKTQGLSLREAIEVTGVPKISAATVNSYLSTYKTFWAWAEAHGHASERLFEGLTVAKKGSASKDRKAFTQEALTKVYDALTDQRGKFYRKTSYRWATLIAMYSGARLNEVCQLHLSDAKLVGDTWVFDFTDEGDDSKRLKTSASQRRMPIHSHLIELGLLDFIAQRQSQGHTRLFPDFTYREKSGYGDQLSKWFNRTFTQNLGIKSEAHVFHGLRHTFTTRLIQAGVETERVQFIVGHERQGVTHQVYAKEGYTVEQCKEAVERYAVASGMLST